ncbi:hypothetical protein C8A03DRAFT_16845, partial [Achaetomium macrosporum]
MADIVIQNTLIDQRDWLTLAGLVSLAYLLSQHSYYFSFLTVYTTPPLYVCSFACMPCMLVGGTASRPPSSPQPKVPKIMEIPVSLVRNEPISLPLVHRPYHVHVTIPFSLLVKDFDPNTTRVPEMERPQSWWATRLFGRRYKTPTDAAAKAFTVAYPAYRYEVWPKLSALLFGKEQPVMHSVSGSDTEDWERAGDSNLFWVFSTGVTDDDTDLVGAVVLKADPRPCSTGGIVFTVEEMGEREKAAWKTAWMDVVLYKSPGAGESGVDLAMLQGWELVLQYLDG